MTHHAVTMSYGALLLHGTRATPSSNFRIHPPSGTLLHCLALQHFKHSTLAFSQVTPHLAKVIPAMDKCDKFLTDCSRNEKLDPAIRVACNIAKGTLNCYYSLTDTSKVYRIAMGKFSHSYPHAFSMLTFTHTAG